MRVLVIDDDPELRFLLVDRLIKEGHEVVGQEVNGEKGVKRAAELAPNIDLILLDVLMPVMDGIAALPLLREIAPPPVKIVFMTALLSSNLVSSENDLGMLGADAAPDGIIAKTNLLDSVGELHQLLAGKDQPGKEST